MISPALIPGPSSAAMAGTGCVKLPEPPIVNLIGPALRMLADASKLGEDDGVVPATTATLPPVLISSGNSGSNTASAEALVPVPVIAPPVRMKLPVTLTALPDLASTMALALASPPVRLAVPPLIRKFPPTFRSSWPVVRKALA
jgi:hypothetical protein